MKKMLLGLFIFGSLLVGIEAQASWVSDSVMREIIQLRSKLGAYAAGYSESVYGTTVVSNVNNDTTPTSDLTPRISYWYGKVNQHVDIASSSWQTDSDGTSGGQLDKLTYCKKFYPNTTSIVEYKAETINTWKDAGNLNNYIGDRKMSYKCVEGSISTPSINLYSNPQSNNGEYVVIKLGNSITFSGVPVNLIGQVGVDYSRSFNFDPLFNDSCLNDGSFDSWSQKCTPNHTGAGSFYIQVIKDGKTYNSNLIKVLVVNDTVIVPSVAPSITVLSPNGRDMYEVGQQINVTWNSAGISNNNKNIDIILHEYNSNGVIVWSKELSSFTYNDGQEKVVLPTNLGGLPYGKNFVISVGTDSTNNPSPIFDYSDSTFTIGQATDVINGGCSNGEVYSSTSGQKCPGTESSSVTVLSPKGGEVFTQGAANKISWSGGKNKIQIGLFSKYNQAGSYAANNSGVVGWIFTNLVNGVNGTSGNWDGNSLTDLNGSGIGGVTPGTYKIVAISESDSGNYCLGDKNSCNSYLSGDITIKSSSNNGCSNGEVYSSTNGQLCQNNRDAYVNLVYPKNGSTFNAGQNVEIKIDSNLTRFGAFEALIYKKDVNNYTFIKKFDTANSGVQTLQIPYNTPEGEYKIDYGHTFGSNDFTKYGTATFYVTNSTISNNDSFAQCLNDKGAILYTASWCSYCQKQKDLLGNSFEKINKVECSSSLVNGQSEICNRENITGYPAWKFRDGSILNGTQSLAALSEKVGCSLPNTNLITVDNGCNGTRYSTATGKYCLNYNDSDLNNVNNQNNNPTPIRRTLKPGLIGDDVKTLQQFLGIYADGVFGRGTAQKVKNWQAQNGLNADGSFGFLSRQKANLAQ